MIHDRTDDVQGDLRKNRETLANYYGEWEQLTQAEGQGIRAADWDKVHRIQAKKRDLGANIQQMLESLRRDAAAAGRGQEVESEFRPVVRRLIELETANREHLARQIERASEREKELQSVSRQVRQVRQAYISPRPPHWERYS